MYLPEVLPRTQTPNLHSAYILQPHNDIHEILLESWIGLKQVSLSQYKRENVFALLS